MLPPDSATNIIGAVPKTIFSSGGNACTVLSYLGNELSSTNFIAGNARLYVPGSATVTREDIKKKKRFYYFMIGKR